MVVDRARVGPHRRLPQPMMRRARRARRAGHDDALGARALRHGLVPRRPEPRPLAGHRGAAVGRRDGRRRRDRRSQRSRSRARSASGVLHLDPVLARADADDALRAQSGWPASTRPTSTSSATGSPSRVRAHVDFTLLGIFVHGDPVEVRGLRLGASRGNSPDPGTPLSPGRAPGTGCARTGPAPSSTLVIERPPPGWSGRGSGRRWRHPVRAV